MNFVYADESRNLLHLILLGTVDRTEAKALLEATRKAIQPLRRGFDILTDLRDVKALERDAVEVIDELMELCSAHEVGRVIRILPQEGEDFGFPIMSFFHYRRDVRIMMCLNLEEAARHLATPMGR